MDETVVFYDPPVPMYCEGDNAPIIAIELPVMYEDEGQEEMGDSAPHTFTTQVLHLGIIAHLAAQPQYRVYSDLNVLYHPIKRRAYFSPDVMVVVPSKPLPEDINSYRIDKDGPAPVLVVEVLSPRTAQQGDLTQKPVIYAEKGIPEYILVDPLGRYLEPRLVLRRLQVDETWLDCWDEDGGVTSALGFRLVFDDDDGKIRVVNASTGQRYLRPNEAEAAEKARLKEEKARKKVDRRNRELEAEIARLKRMLPPEHKD